MHIWPLPKIEFLPFAELEERHPVALVTSRLAWEAVQDKLRHAGASQTRLGVLTLCADCRAIQSMMNAEEESLGK